jgi:hypothetical protein
MSVTLKRAVVAIATVVMSTLAVTLDCAASDVIAKTPSENTGLRVAFVDLEAHGDSSSPDSFLSSYLTSLIPGVIYSKLWEFTGHSIYHSNCLKERLNQSSAFAVINKEDWPALQKKYGEYDLLVTGAVEYDKTTEYKLSYGVSFLSLYTKMFGAPDKWHERHILMDISVRHPSDPYRLLYQKQLEIHGSKQFTNSLWYKGSLTEDLKECTQEEKEAIDELVKGVRVGGPIAQALAERKTKENH